MWYVTTRTGKLDYAIKRSELGLKISQAHFRLSGWNCSGNSRGDRERFRFGRHGHFEPRGQRIVSDGERRGFGEHQFPGADEYHQRQHVDTGLADGSPRLALGSADEFIDQRPDHELVDLAKFHKPDHDANHHQSDGTDRVLPFGIPLSFTPVVGPKPFLCPTAVF